MSVIIKPGVMKYRDPTDGTYKGVDAVAERTTSEQVADINAAGVSQVAAVNAAGQAAQSIIPDQQTFTNLSNDFAPQWAANTAYAAGAYVMHDYKLYSRKTATAGDETFSASDWTLVNTGTEITNLKTQLTKYFDIDSDSALYIDNTLVKRDGTTSGSESWCASDFVNVYGAGGCEVKVGCTVYGNAAVCWYNKDKTLMGYISSDNCSDYGITASTDFQEISFVLPTGAAYIRCCALKTTIGNNSMFVFAGAFNDSALVKSIQATGDENAENVDNIKNFIGPIQWKNKVNPDEITESAYIRASDGKLIDNNNYNNATGYIYLEPNTKYYVGEILMNNNNAFYTTPSENTFVSNPDVTLEYSGDPAWYGTITTGNTGYYFRGTIGKNRSNPYLSSYASTYLPYGIVTLDDEIPDIKVKGKILILGDSISSDAYGNYKKWVTVLKERGDLPSDVTNSSQHASGFVARYNNQPNDFISRMEGIVDKSSYDMVIVFGGINDYIQNIPLGGEEGETDKTVYFKPAVDYFFDYLINNFTQARICVLLPLRTYNVYPNTAGNKQEVYAQYIHDVAKSYCLPVLNLTEESGFCPFITSFKNM